MDDGIILIEFFLGIGAFSYSIVLLNLLSRCPEPCSIPRINAVTLGVISLLGFGLIVRSAMQGATDILSRLFWALV